MSIAEHEEAKGLLEGEKELEGLPRMECFL